MPWAPVSSSDMRSGTSTIHKAAPVPFERLVNSPENSGSRAAIQGPSYSRSRTSQMAAVDGYEVILMLHPDCRTPDASTASAPLPQVYKEDGSLLAWPNVLHRHFSSFHHEE